MSAQTVTHKDLAAELGVSETTIKSYRSKFPTFLPVAREGKPVRLHAEALDVCRRIRDLFADGLSILQTTQALRGEFKEYPLNRRLSTSSAQKTPAAAGASPAEADPALAARLEALALAQDQARERMAQLETEVRNLATLEAASKAMVAELVAELRAARAAGIQVPATASPAGMAQAAAKPEPPKSEPQKNELSKAKTQEPAAKPTSAKPASAKASAQAAGATAHPEDTVLTARRIVTVHGAVGPVASYALGREPKPAPLFPEPEQPEAAFLALPAVIRSDRGDFLGLPGGQSVRRLVEVFSPDGGAGATWFAEGPDAWTCAIPLGRAQKREIVFERTTTPRGNMVGLIRRMRINEAEATPTQLQEIFRQLRDQMA